MSTNLYSVSLKRLTSTFRHDAFLEATYHIKHTIDDLDAYMVGLSSKALEPENFESMREIADATTEQLNGASLVTAQTVITKTVTRVKSLHDLASSNGFTLTSVSPNKAQMLSVSSDQIGGSGITKVSAIDTLANFFKHHDEWPSDWSKSNGLSKVTITALQSLGFSSKKIADIIPKGLTMLGGNILVLPDILLGWQNGMAKSLDAELKSLGLL